MDAQSKAKLDEILSKEVAAMSEDDIAFLRARRSYLTKSQAIDLADVLADFIPEPEVEGMPALESEAAERPWTRRGRKAPTEL
jgi:hypothetical protein